MLISQLEIIDPRNRHSFNVELDKINKNCVDLGHEECCEHIVKVVVKEAKEVKNDCKGWFEKNRIKLLLFIEERNRVLIEVKSKQCDDEGLQKSCRGTKTSVNDAILVSKGSQVKSQIDKIILIRFHPKEAWEHVINFKKGLQSHHEITNTVGLRDKSRKLDCTCRESTKISGDQFHNIFDRESN